MKPEILKFQVNTVRCLAIIIGHFSDRGLWWSAEANPRGGATFECRKVDTISLDVEQTISNYDKER